MTFVPKPKKFRSISLEMSLKPFFDNSAPTRRAVCRKMFRQWLPLCEHADEVQVMLWTSDGSEILDYRGDLETELEWGRYLGGANRGHHELEQPAADPKDNQGIGTHGDEADPDGIGLHRRPYVYRESPATFTYRWLKGLAEDLKREGEAILERPVVVGNTFDPGPEFAKSDFKYRRHREICLGGALYGQTFAGCAATLHGDGTAYAAFPGGIPEGTSLGTFLGRQLAAFNRDLGLDFIWFSNGFGFGMETWGLNGAVFDGQRFKPEAVAACADGITRFWRDFRAECPGLPVRVRGTNLTTGIDLASDGVPLKSIYEEHGPVEAPVNSPWAALDGDFGLEMAGWMSHIAGRTPGYPFRFYTHDPWWMNSPWLDRYQRQPHDIYIPLSVSRINADGEVETPDTVAVLSVDDSRGELPAQVPAEVVAHILRARENAPDQAGPLVWLYPFDEYHEMTFSENPRLGEVYFGDWYIRGAINEGLPLNTVVSTASFQALEDTLGGSLLITPVPAAGSALRRRLLDRGNVVFYGPIEAEDAELLGLFGLEPAPPAEGDFALHFENESRRLHHPAIISAGALALKGKAFASAEQEGVSYALAARAGTIGWLRGSVSCNEVLMGGPLPFPLDRNTYFPAESLAAKLAGEICGLSVSRPEGKHAVRTPIHAVSRSRNGFVFSGYNPEEVDGLEFNTQHGAPVWTGRHVEVGPGGASYPPTPAWHHECRLFVQQAETSRIYCQELPAAHYGVNRRLLLKNLKNATVRFFPETGTEGRVKALRNPAFPYLLGDFQTLEKGCGADGPCLEIPSISGELLFSW